MVHYAKNDELFAPGQIVDGFYMVVSGTLESRVPSNPGTADRTGEDFVRILGPGDHWGERSLSDGTKTQGWLTAVDDCEVMVLARNDFAALRRGLPPLADHLEHIPEKIYPPGLRHG